VSVLFVDVDLMMENAREGCYCAPYHKPCGYHEGMQDGMEQMYAVTKALVEGDESDE
jgi:hypothetical protein